MGPTPLPPFHLAFPVNDIDIARDFYIKTIGCEEGRSSSSWVDFSLFGHQIVAHLVEGYSADRSSNEVDGDPVPIPHFGCALSVQQFHDLAERLTEKGVQFIIKPHLRFVGQPGEQYTCFFKDPSGNALEFKAMTNPDNLFTKGASLILPMSKRSKNGNAASLQAAKRICIEAIEDTTDLCLFKYDQLVSAFLGTRYKRFLGDVRLDVDGAVSESETITIHVPNTGPMTGLLDALPASVFLSKSSNASRKYAHTLEWIKADGAWVGTHSAKANAFVKVLLQANAIPELLPYVEIRPEVKYGSENSRVDFCLERGEAGRQCLAEVKSVTLAEDTEEGTRIALFPDTVSVRAQRHVRELTNVVNKGGEAALIFLVQRGDCVAFAPCFEKDPEYSNLVVAAVAAGVKVVALACDLDPIKGHVVFKGTIPLRLDYKRP